MVGSLLGVSAQAAVSCGNGYTGQPYMGVKFGKFDLDIDGVKDPTAYGVYGGYNFDPNFDPNFGIEAESDILDSDINLITVGAHLKF